MRAQGRRFEREVTLSRRQVGHGLKNTYQNRDGRRVRLAMGATRVVIRKPHVDPSTVQPIAVNVVHVVEVDPPPGEDVLEWLLLTTEPIDTDDKIAFIIDSYRARWVVEEYFKALKTGCAYEARQLESYDALLLCHDSDNDGFPLGFELRGMPAPLRKGGCDLRPSGKRGGSDLHDETEALVGGDGGAGGGAPGMGAEQEVSVL